MQLTMGFSLQVSNETDLARRVVRVEVLLT